MSARLYQVITTADPVAPEKRHRQWLDVGEPLVVAGVMLIMLIERGREPWLALHDRQGEYRGDVPMSPLSFGATPYRVIPRAYRFHPNGMAEAVLLEIQYTGAQTPAWQHNEENTHANLQPISDAS